MNKYIKFLLKCLCCIAAALIFELLIKIILKIPIV